MYAQTVLIAAPQRPGAQEVIEVAPVGLPPPMRQFQLENKDAITSLIKRMRSWNAVTVFVGAGLSKPLGYGLWEEFLRRIASQRTGLWMKVRRHAKTDLSYVAQLIEDELGKATFQQAIINEFGNDRLRRRPSGPLSGALSIIPDLVNGPAITTNLDHVLERTFEREGVHLPAKAVAWGESAERLVNRGLFWHPQALIKFHGDHTDPASWIITRRQYDERYGTLDDLDRILGSKRESRRYPQAHSLAIIAQARPLFFIGCSLRQDRTLSILHHLAGRPEQNRHWALVERPTTPNELDERRRTLAAYSIMPIWYPAGQHDCVEGFLKYVRSRRPDGLRRAS